MTRIILNGCSGRMGQIITKLAAADPEVEIAAGVDVAAAGNPGYPVFPELSQCTVEGDVIVDFSLPSGTDALLAWAKEKGLPLVLCTTGLSEEQLSAVKEASGQIPILRSANMSLGVNLLFKVLKEISGTLASAGFDIEIVEKHHNQKKDAPSGTALALAEAINEGLEENYEFCLDRSGRNEKRPVKEIGISAVRGGTIPGDHDVIFAGEDETITFSHRAYSRAVFGKGALAAAKFLAGKAPGFYTMADVLG